MATRWQLCVCFLGLFLLVPCALSETFSLDGSLHPVVGVVGQDVVLPCQLSPRARLANMYVLWRKIGTEFIPVHEYSDDGPKDQPAEGYQSRTELFPQEFSNGNVSLKLKQLQEADAGTYHCFVRDPDWSQEATAKLQVAAVAPVFIEVLGPQGQGIGLACRSAGWFPKPEIQWFGKNQKNLATEIMTDVTQDGGNLYSVASHVTITAEDTGEISCIMRNDLLKTERQSAIHLSGDIFPRASPWLAAFLALLVLVLVAAGVCTYLGYRAKRKASQKKPSEEEALFALEHNKTLKTEGQELREKMDIQEKTFEGDLKKLQQELDTEKKEKEDLQSDFKKLQQKLDTEKKEEDLQSDFKKLQQELDTEKKEKEDLQSDFKKLQQELDTEKKEEDLQSDFKKLQQELDTEKKEKEDLQSDLEKLKQELDAQRKAFEADTEKKTLVSECQYLRNKKESQESEIQQLKSEFQKLHKTKKLQEIEIKELKSESQENEIKQLKSEKEEEIDTKPSPLHSPSPGLRNDSMELAAAAASHPVLPLDEEKKQKEETETENTVTEPEKEEKEETETKNAVTEPEKAEKEETETENAETEPEGCRLEVTSANKEKETD